MKIIISFLILFSSTYSQAYLRSDFDANWGVTFLEMSIGDVGSRSLESYTTIELGYNLIFSSIDTALNINFMEIASSNFGDLPMTRLALGPRWYIRGLNGTRVLLDSQVQGRTWKPSPFIGMQVGVSSISFGDETDPRFPTNSLNAAVIDANVELGLETPISSDILLLGQFSYLTSLMSGADEGRPAFSYGGLQIFLGLKMTQF